MHVNIDMHRIDMKTSISIIKCDIDWFHYCFYIDNDFAFLWASTKLAKKLVWRLFLQYGIYTYSMWNIHFVWNIHFELTRAYNMTGGALLIVKVTNIEPFLSQKCTQLAAKNSYRSWSVIPIPLKFPSRSELDTSWLQALHTTVVSIDWLHLLNWYYRYYTTSIVVDKLYYR